VAIYVSFAATLLFEGASRGPLLGLLVGAAYLMVVGIVDDARGMNPWIKLLAQLGGASVAVACGIQITFLGSPYLNVPFTLLWIVGMTNAFSLLDNMDGLAGGVAMISASAFVTFLRLRGGRPVFQGEGDHSSHRLVSLGLGQAEAV
jgi:UDP-GlcNAc:undecaprenyl-phosphate GlcNAc-1-phosphate transferase